MRILLKKDPGHLGGTILMTRLVLESEGPARPWPSSSKVSRPSRRSGVGNWRPWPLYLGISLCRSGLPIAGFKHLELVPLWGVSFDESNVRAIASLRANAAFTPWEKNPYRLSPPPEGVTDAFRESFERAVGWAEEGLWASAASAFELLAAASSAGAIAERNRGLCCLWIGDHPGAVAALRRYIARTGPSVDSVDLEAVCQRIATTPAGDSVEFVHLSWPIRNREGLLEALRADPGFEQGPERAPPSRRPGFLAHRAILPARPQEDRREARTHPSGRPGRRGRGDRRQGHGRARDLRRRPARSAMRPVHGRGAGEHPAVTPPHQGDREGVAASARDELAVERAQGHPGGRRRAAQPRAEGLHHQ